MKKTKSLKSVRSTKTRRELKLDQFQTHLQYYAIGKICREQQISVEFLADMLGSDRKTAYRFYSGVYVDRLCPHCIDRVLGVIVDHLRNQETIETANLKSKMAC